MKFRVAKAAKGQRSSAPSPDRFLFYEGTLIPQSAFFYDPIAFVKIGILGCGAVGSYYGAKLCRDGHETHFLLRSDYELVKRRGVTIWSDEGGFIVRPKSSTSAEQIGVCDLVFVAIKNTANSQLPYLLPSLVGEKTAVVSLQNGLGSEEAIARIVGEEHVLGGLCFVCLNRIEPGVIHHIAHGQITLGEFMRWPEPRTHDVASAIRHAGISCRVTSDLMRARWEKLVWNISRSMALEWLLRRATKLLSAANRKEIFPVNA